MRTRSCRCSSCVPRPVPAGFVACPFCRRQYHEQAQQDLLVPFSDGSGVVYLCADFCAKLTAARALVSSCPSCPDVSGHHGGLGVPPFRADTRHQDPSLPKVGV